MFAYHATIHALNSIGTQCLNREALATCSAHLTLASLPIIHICDANSVKSFAVWYLYRQRSGGSQPVVELSRQNSMLVGLELLSDKLSLILIFFPSQFTRSLQNLPPFLGSRPTLCVSQVIHPGEVLLFGFKFRCYISKLNSKTSRTWTRLRGARSTSCTKTSGHK